MPGELVIGDWGSSRLRLWRIAAGEPAGRRDGPGIAGNPNPAATLAAILDGWHPGRITLSGMAGARDGLHEVAYVPCPVTSTEWANGSSKRDFAGIPLRIACGLTCRDEARRPDVMRGEETQVFGAIALDPALAQGSRLVLLPGTHSKWARLQGGCITGFSTFMTGEMFALLKRSSLLSALKGTEGSEDQGFAAGLDRSAGGGQLTADLFEARSAQLCDGKSANWAKVNAIEPAEPVLVIGEPELADRYRKALALRGVESTLADGDECVIAGLRMLDERD